MDTNTTPALRATNIHQSFGSVDALRGVSLTLNPGEIVALLGVNGAGKSTTLMTICGGTPPRSGEVLFRGQPNPHAQAQQDRGARHQPGARKAA